MGEIGHTHQARCRMLFDSLLERVRRVASNSLFWISAGAVFRFYAEKYSETAQRTPLVPEWSVDEVNGRVGWSFLNRVDLLWGTPFFRGVFPQRLHVKKSGLISNFAVFFPRIYVDWPLVGPRDHGCAIY
jgi:hypothetical protein